MIQRIQSLYLFAVVVLGILLCCFSPVEFLPNGSSELIQLSSFSKWPLAIISAIIPLLALVDLFLYKKRILQARLNAINIILCLGYYAIVAVYVIYGVNGHEQIAGQLIPDAAWYPTLWGAIPLVNLVLSMMAMRRILHDEALVRAADRLR